MVFQNLLLDACGSSSPVPASTCLCSCPCWKINYFYILRHNLTMLHGFVKLIDSQCSLLLRRWEGPWGLCKSISLLSLWGNGNPERLCDFPKVTQSIEPHLLLIKTVGSSSLHKWKGKKQLLMDSDYINGNLGLRSSLRSCLSLWEWALSKFILYFVA